MIISIDNPLFDADAVRKRGKESDPAKSLRIMTEAIKKPGGTHYKNLVHLQVAKREMKEYREHNLKLVEASE